MPENVTLWVVTHRTWLYRHLAAGARPGVTVRHSLGLGLPAGLDAAWSPMEWAADAAASGARLHRVDPGPGWLPQLPADLTGRRVSLLPLSRVIVDGPTEAFFKPANVKVESCPARWGTATGFAADAASSGLTGATPVLVCEERLDLAAEYRVFVLAGRPVAVSVYAERDRVFGQDLAGGAEGEAAAFAARVCARVPALVPPAFVLDVAVTAAGEWLVVEANPAWSSNPYDADPVGVIATVLASCRPDPVWAWRPDPWLVARATARRPLPLDTDI